MPFELETYPKMPRPMETKGALTSASSSLAGWFLRDNIDRGIPLKIPSLNIVVYPDGTVIELGSLLNLKK